MVKYRPEIVGLRAISVMAVFLFHLGCPPARGGYLGVDVFFVISGYLITGLVHCELRAKKFSVASFYARSIRRIAPALLLTVL
jgi:peptidoglycan/LPS O-acetylase OafA/YrhL